MYGGETVALDKVLGEKSRSRRFKFEGRQAVSIGNVFICLPAHTA
jgi:hypothetical protein